MQETVILQDKPALAPALALIPAVIIGFSCPLTFMVPLLQSTSFFLAVYGMIAISTIVLAIIKTTIQLIRREFSTFTLTDKRIITEEGILNRDKNSITLDKVKSTSIQYPLAGQILNYGNVIVRTWTNSVRLFDVPNPKNWEREISKHIG